MTSQKLHTVVLTLAAICAFAALEGCRSDMMDQNRGKPYAVSNYYGDSLSVRLPVKGTVAHGDPRTDSAFYFGRANGKLVTEFPIAVNMATLERGRSQFNVFCSPCHGQTGDGRGMIVQRGFPAPPSYHIDRLRQVPPGYIYETISKGFGKMFDYSARIQPADRWAIAAYVKALQLSQRAPVNMLTEDDQRQLNEPKPVHTSAHETEHESGQKE